MNAFTRIGKRKERKNTFFKDITWKNKYLFYSPEIKVTHLLNATVLFN